MAAAELINTFENGMVMDSLKYLQAKGTYRYAKNMTKGDREHFGYGLAVEEGNKKLHTFSSNIVGAYYVESLDASVYFTVDGSIHLFDHNTREVTFVAQDKEFGCNWGFQDCEWISATFKTDQPCNETKVYWSSGCDYYVLNIAEMLNPKRKNAIKQSILKKDGNVCGYTCEYFKLMKCICSPNITPVISDKGGHKLEGGVYQFAVQLEDNGGNTSNWFSVTDPISVPSENNQPGEMSLSSIKLHITGLDCRYDKVNIAVVKTINGIITARLVDTRHFSTDGITLTYNGQDRGRELSFLEIMSKRKMYIRGKDVAQKDSQLYLYGIRQEKNLNMQRRVINEADLTFIEIETTAKMVERHGMRTLERGENYLFAVVYNYCDGTHSPAFLMRPLSTINEPKDVDADLKTPTGEAQKMTRPRGNTNDEGGVLGCSTGRCGGCAGGGCGAVTQNRATNNEEENTENKGDRFQENVASWDTAVEDMVEAGKCDNCQEPWCCHPETGECLDCATLSTGNCDGCHKDEEAFANDVPKFEDIIGNHTDELIYAAKDQDPQYDQYTFKTAAERLIEEVENAEYRVIKRDRFKISTSAAKGEAPEENPTGEIPDPTLIKEPTQKGFAESRGTVPPTEPVKQEEFASKWSDEYTDARGNYLLEETPKVVGRIAPQKVFSEEKYPDSVDCDGEFLYGSLRNTNVQLFRTPTADASKIVVPTATGVPSQNSTVDPINSVKIRLLGIEVKNIPQPRAEDLPKPLCGNNPYSIVMVPRDEVNSTVQAKGIMFGTFTGEANGETITYLRHGANSRCNLDRWVDDRRQSSIPSRKGNTLFGPGIAFYGLDTAIGRVGLSGRTLRTELKFDGQGYRYGLYEKGIEPTEGLTGRRVDQRGARQYINLNVPRSQLNTYDISALGYLDADAVTEVSGAVNKVSTKHRESCVYLESAYTINPTDSSFTADTLNHDCPIPDAFGIYGAIVRDVPDQYGSVTGMSFIKTGLEGRSFSTAYRGVIGDTFIGPYSFVRKGFVSDKVGNTFGTPERERTVCDSPNDLILQKFGLDFYPTQLPVSGDRSDAKNWAGGHQDNPWNQAYPNPPQDDYYYPKVQKTLITTWIESRINPWYRATGMTDAKELGEVFYPKLKDLKLDSASSSSKHPWEKSFLNRFYYRIDQPSVAQLMRKYLIKAFVGLLMPMLGLDKLSDITGVVDGVSTLMVGPIFVAYWYMMKKILTRDDFLDNMLGLPGCKTDAAGGETDHFLENFEDNYHAYNYDHSKLNTFNVYQAMPTNYNTCDCDDCLNGETTNEIYYSEKQIQNSPIDFYKQFKALSFLTLNADVGKLNKLITVGGDFYAHTTDFLIPIKFKNASVESSVGTLILGGDRILEEPTPYFEGVVEGFAGNLDPNAGINTNIGYVFIDRQARKLFIFNGKAPTVASSIGMDRFFKEHLDFCGLSGCHDEKNEAGTYYSLGFDPIYNRILVTKKELNSAHSFTVSLDVSGEQPSWTSFHDYIPQDYVWDRKNLYTLKDKSIYLQNSNEGVFRTFYGSEYPSEVEFVTVGDSESFLYQDTFINSEAEVGGLRNLDDTFNRIAAYNSTEGTGTRPVRIYGDNADTRLNPGDEYSETGEIKLHKVKRGFRFNTLKDNVKTNCGNYPMIIKDKCEPIEKINEEIFSCLPDQRRNYRGKVLQDDHIVYRFTYDRDPSVLLRLLTVKTNATKEIR
jgi:hypothetical protein